MVTPAIASSLTDLGTDILIFVATEVFVRLIFPQRRDQVWLLLTQGSLLLVIAAIVLIFHHKPYILGLITLFVFVRLISVVTDWRAQPENNTPISRPLRYTPETEIGGSDAHVTSTGIPETVTDNRERAAVVTGHTYTPPVQQAGYTLWSQPGSITSSWNTSLNPVVRRRTYGNEMGVHGHSTSTLATSHSSFYSTIGSLSDSQRPESSIPLKPSLGCFTSFLNFPQPSTTPPGLINPGNTCFINSILQCLTWTNDFMETLPLVVSGDNNQTTFLRSLNGVLHHCHMLPDGVSKFSPIDTSELLFSLSQLAPHLVVTPKSGLSQSQQDAAEFLMWLLDCLHNTLKEQSDGGNVKTLLSTTEVNTLLSEREACLSELKSANSDDIPSFRDPLAKLSQLDWQLNWQKNSSTLYKQFLGQLLEARECQQCKTMSVNMEYFTLLPLSVPDIGLGYEYSLHDCFVKFSQVEDLVQSNMLRCSCTLSQQNVDLTPGKRLALLSKPPKRLVIQLTRFSYDSSTTSATKNMASIHFPLIFDLHKHTMEAKLGKHEQGSMVYHLYAFCIHTGAQSTSHGHYIAYCKVANGSWYCFNDTFVEYISDIQAEITNTLVLYNAYLLFYILQE